MKKQSIDGYIGSCKTYIKPWVIQQDTENTESRKHGDEEVGRYGLMEIWSQWIHRDMESRKQENIYVHVGQT